MTRDDVFRAIYKNDLFWIAGRMIKCLLSRLDFLKRFCDGEETEENVTVGSSTLNIPSSIALLIDLGDAHKVSMPESRSPLEIFTFGAGSCDRCVQSLC